MTTNYYRELLKESWDLNDRLKELIIECFDALYGKESIRAKNDFENLIRTFSEDYCLPSLEYFNKEVAKYRDFLKSKENPCG